MNNRIEDTKLLLHEYSMLVKVTQLTYLRE